MSESYGWAIEAWRNEQRPLAQRIVGAFGVALDEHTPDALRVEAQAWIVGHHDKPYAQHLWGQGDTIETGDGGWISICPCDWRSPRKSKRSHARRALGMHREDAEVSERSRTIEEVEALVTGTDTVQRSESYETVRTPRFVGRPAESRQVRIVKVTTYEHLEGAMKLSELHPGMVVWVDQSNTGFTGWGIVLGITGSRQTTARRSELSGGTSRRSSRSSPPEHRRSAVRSAGNHAAKSRPAGSAPRSRGRSSPPTRTTPRGPSGPHRPRKEPNRDRPARPRTDFRIRQVRCRPPTQQPQRWFAAAALAAAREPPTCTVSRLERSETPMTTMTADDVLARFRADSELLDDAVEAEATSPEDTPPQVCEALQRDPEMWYEALRRVLADLQSDRADGKAAGDMTERVLAELALHIRLVERRISLLKPTIFAMRREASEQSAGARLRALLTAVREHRAAVEGDETIDPAPADTRLWDAAAALDPIT